MILKQVIYVPRYDWEVIIYYNANHPKAIANSLLSIGCRGDRLADALKFIEKNGRNTGFIYSNYIDRVSVIVIGRSDSIGEFINTIEHEKNHLEMHICKALKIDPYSEEAAILSGYLAQVFVEEALSTVIDYV